MLFTSSQFLLFFFPFVLFIYYVVLKSTRKGQNLFLTLASLVFYAFGEPYFVLIMIGSILFNWLAALAVDHWRTQRKLCIGILTFMLTVNLGILGIFKYLMFILGNVNTLLGAQFYIPHILLPLGISFFTFQAISYVIDVYRGHGVVQKNPLNVALYIAFFPQLIAGPIVRYETIAHQIENRRENWNDFTAGLARFCLGLAKKMIVANNLSVVADMGFASPDQCSVLMAWLAAIAYTFQIYFDFSAYSDMAIGLGRMFGFRFLENFNYPYISRSITEFWRRWHISLGTWFRDYVYIPLGGSRVSSTAHFIFNLFVVWLLTGIWHGANWTFLCWGLLYFVLLLAEKLTGFEKRLSYFSWIYVMFFTIIGWVLFRAENLAVAQEMISTMLFLNDKNFSDTLALYYIYEYGAFFVIACIASCPIYPWLKRRYSSSAVYSTLYFASLILLFLISLSFIIQGGTNPFIYSNF